MIKRPSDIPHYFDLVGNLEEFGLSKYESMAYITLVSRGTLGASEIAYYSNLPRTKIYTTLKKSISQSCCYILIIKAMQK